MEQNKCSKTLDNNTIKIRIFRGLKGVATATKFKQKTAKVALNSVLCKKSRQVVIVKMSACLVASFVGQLAH